VSFIIPACFRGGDMTLQLPLQENAKAFPGRIWLRYEDVQRSYADGDIITRRIAAGSSSLA
jgi:hypothetical protein